MSRKNLFRIAGIIGLLIVVLLPQGSTNGQSIFNASFKDFDDSYTDITSMPYTQIDGTQTTGNRTSGVWAYGESDQLYCYRVVMEGEYDYLPLSFGSNTVSFEFGITTGEFIDSLTYNIESTHFSTSAPITVLNATSLTTISMYSSGAAATGTYRIEVEVNRTEDTTPSFSKASYVRVRRGGNPNGAWQDMAHSVWYSSDCAVDPQYTGPEPTPEPPAGSDENVAIVVDGLPIVSGNPAITTCYDCTPPIRSYSPALWIAWLGCLLNNLLLCYIYHELLVIANYLLGIVSYFAAYTTWAATNAQLFINWVVSLYNNVRLFLMNSANGVSVQVNISIVESSSSSLSTLIAIFLLVFEIIFNLLISIAGSFDIIFSFMSNIVSGIRAAFTAPPATLEFLIAAEASGDYSALAPALATVGSTPEKILVIFIWSVLAFDTVLLKFAFTSILNIIFVGIVAYKVFLWLVKEWSRIIPV